MLTLVSFAVAGCSSPSPDNTSAPGNPPGKRATEAEASSSSGPLAVTVRPPAIFVGPAEGTPPADMPTPPAIVPGDWQTFTNPDLGVSVDYPSAWVVDYQDGAATFSSPQGPSILLQVAEAGNQNGPIANNQDCVSLTNSYGLTAEVCSSSTAPTYRASFDFTKRDGSLQHLTLSTTNPEALDVYKLMLNSVRPAP